MPQQAIPLIVGLGNPGDTYEKTRHNVGFQVIDAVAEAFSISLDKNKFDAVFGRGRMRGRSVMLAKPLAYMNRSGLPTRRLADYFRISVRELIVVHDDIDLDLGRIKIKEKGGDGGHKGIRSIMDAFGGGGFTRLRIGVGRSEAGDVVGHVLGKFSPDEARLLDETIVRAKTALVMLLCQGAKETMNVFHRKEPQNFQAKH
jgi:PTH1 family peptidyl-tRNA hydrolase